GRAASRAAARGRGRSRRRRSAARCRRRARGSRAWLECSTEAGRPGTSRVPGRPPVLPAAGGRGVALSSQRGGDLLEDPVEGGRGAHHRGGLLEIGAVVAADVRRLALHREQLLRNGLLAVGELLRDRGEGGGELGVLALRGQLLRPVKGQVEVAAEVVDRAEIALRGLALVQTMLGELDMTSL